MRSTMLIALMQVTGEKQIDNILEAGLKDPTTRAILVLALIFFVAFFLHMKFYRPSRIAELTLKSNIEQARANQTSNIVTTAATQERSVVAAARVLELSEKHLEKLADVRKCMKDGE